MEDTAWFKVLYYWCYEKTPVGSGLTIPFLIGVERNFGRGKGFDASDLIYEFASLSSEHSIIIEDCNDIGNEVCRLEILEIQEKEYYRKSFGSLYLPSAEYKDIQSLDELRIMFSRDYQINDKEYSINRGQWGDFNSEDLEIIENSLQS